MRTEIEESTATLSTLIDRLEEGVEFVITRHGKVVARLVAATPLAIEGFGGTGFEYQIRRRIHGYDDLPKKRLDHGYHI